MFTFSNRVKRVIQHAALAMPTGRDVINPFDLFVGGLLEGTSVLGELYLHGRFRIAELQVCANQYGLQDTKVPCSISPTKPSISASLMEMLHLADDLRKKYRQCMINEGHLYSAILDLCDIASLLKTSSSNITEDDIRQIVCEPRDMVVALENFPLPTCAEISEVIIRRADKGDEASLCLFVQQTFSSRWLDAVHNGFTYVVPPIFLAMRQDEIIGFGCYDVVRFKKGTFGPMGVLPSCRESGLGKSLLHHCLFDMKRCGYAYAIIDEAGPIEFYERACGAVVIPKPTER